MEPTPNPAPEHASLPTIALVGAGEYLEASREIDEHLLAVLAAKGRPPRVACLPTAASLEGEGVWRGWSRRGVQWFTSLGAVAVAVDVVDRQDAHDPDLVAVVRDSDLVYLSGGNPKHLHEVLANTPAWEAIAAVLARGGVLAGCSAGAMVQGSHIAGFRGGPGSEGFGLLPGAVVIPHFNEFPSMISGVLRRVLGRGHTVIGIDAGTALVRHLGDFHVLGSGGVEVWGPEGHHRFEREPVPAAVVAPLP